VWPSNQFICAAPHKRQIWAREYLD